MAEDTLLTEDQAQALLEPDQEEEAPAPKQQQEAPPNGALTIRVDNGNGHDDLHVDAGGWVWHELGVFVNGGRFWYDGVSVERDLLVLFDKIVYIEFHDLEA